MAAQEQDGEAGKGQEALANEILGRAAKARHRSLTKEHLAQMFDQRLLAVMVILPSFTPCYYVISTPLPFQGAADLWRQYRGLRSCACGAFAGPRLMSGAPAGAMLRH